MKITKDVCKEVHTDENLNENHRREILENSKEMSRFFLANLKSIRVLIININAYNIKKKIRNIKMSHMLITTKEES